MKTSSKITRRAALAAGASTLALAGLPTVAAPAPEPDADGPIRALFGRWLVLRKEIGAHEARCRAFAVAHPQPKRGLTYWEEKDPSIAPPELREAWEKYRAETEAEYQAQEARTAVLADREFALSNAIVQTPATTFAGVRIKLDVGIALHKDGCYEPIIAAAVSVASDLERMAGAA